MTSRPNADKWMARLSGNENLGSVSKLLHGGWLLRV
jgi:hypothetical protein